MRVLQDVQQRAACVVQALGLLHEAPPVALVVAQDVDHRLALVGQLLVEAVEVVHDVDHGTPPLVALAHARIEQRKLAAQLCVLVAQPVALILCRGGGLQRQARIYDHEPPPRSARVFSRSFLRLSISFSSSLLLSSRPTNTSSHFSRSRIFSCSSAFDSCKSITACS